MNNIDTVFQTLRVIYYFFQILSSPLFAEWVLDQVRDMAVYFYYTLCQHELFRYGPYDLTRTFLVFPPYAWWLLEHVIFA